MKPSHLFMIPLLMLVTLMSVANAIAWGMIGSTHVVIFALVTVALSYELFTTVRDLRRLRAAK